MMSEEYLVPIVQNSPGEHADAPERVVTLALSGVEYQPGGTVSGDAAPEGQNTVAFPHVLTREVDDPRGQT